MSYYELTEKPLRVTGEIAEYEAARILNLELWPARQSGYDAVRTGAHPNKRLQIKGRRSSKPGQRVGTIDLEGSGMRSSSFCWMRTSSP